MVSNGSTPVYSQLSSPGEVCLEELPDLIFFSYSIYIQGFEERAFSNRYDNTFGIM
jgi:hypothetical protein